MDHRLDHRPRRLAPDLRRHRGQLDAGVLEGLLQALDLPGPGFDLGLPVAGDVAEFPDLCRRHEARTDHAVSRDVGEPLGVREIALASRHVLYVLRVAEPQLVEQPFEAVVVGSDQGAVSAFQPVRFPGPPSEPDVRLSPHPALHVSVPAGYAAS